MKIFVDYEQIIETCFHHLWLAQTTFILFQIIIICKKKKNQTIIFPFVSKKQNLFYLILVVIVVLITRRYDDTLWESISCHFSSIVSIIFICLF